MNPYHCIIGWIEETIWDYIGWQKSSNYNNAKIYI